jgi:1,2-diacylglycerol 3-beta-glucosyltransferase
MLSTVWLLERWLPAVSIPVLALVFMVTYLAMQTAAQIHRKRQEKKQRRQREQNGQSLQDAPPPDACEEAWPFISVLVPAHNEEAVIAQCVHTLSQLDYPRYDLWIIDDRSQDGTLAVLQQLLAQQPGKFRVLSRALDAIPGKSAVLNDALAHCAGPWVAVFDADASIAPDFLRKLAPFLREPDVGAVQARKVIHNSVQHWLARLQDYEYALDTYFQCGRDSIRGAVELRGNGCLIKRQALLAVDGWTESSLTDDLDLSTKLHLAGWDVRFAHKVLVYEEGITDFRALLRQRRRWAEGSLTRYLTYAGLLLRSPHSSLRTRIDMMAYFFEFLMPLWLLLDYVGVGLAWGMGDPNPTRVLTSLCALPLISVFFTTHLIIAIFRFHKPSPVAGVLGAFWTGFYMTWVWIPVVFWIFLKRVAGKNTGFDWGKTTHYGAPQPAHRALSSGKEAPAFHATHI